MEIRKPLSWEHLGWVGAVWMGVGSLGWAQPTTKPTVAKQPPTLRRASLAPRLVPLLKTQLKNVLPRSQAAKRPPKPMAFKAKAPIKAVMRAKVPRKVHPTPQKAVLTIAPTPPKSAKQLPTGPKRVQPQRVAFKKPTPALAKVVFRSVELRWVADSPSRGQENVPNWEGANTFPLQKESLMDDIAFVQAVSLRANPVHQRYHLYLELTSIGSQRFAALTRKNVGRQLAILVDGKVALVASIRTEIRTHLLRLSTSTRELQRRLYNLIKGPTHAANP